MRRTAPLYLVFLGLLLAAAFPLTAQARITQLAQPLNVLHAIDDPAKKRPKMVRTVWDIAPFTGRQAALPVLGIRKYGEETWARVILAGRPNGLRGWIRTKYVKLVPNRWAIRVDLSNRTMVVRQDGKMVKRLRVVVGAPSTPTPRGSFYIEDRTRLTQSWGQSGWALATSAYSDVLRHFEGGQGQIAIHSRGTLSDPMGSAASHGCVRVPARFAKWLAQRIPPGTPLDIVR